MQPIRNNVLVKPFASDEVTTGGIYVPESAREVSNKMTVVAVGNGIAKDKMQFSLGDVVYRVKGWGLEVIIGGEKHFLMSQKDILAIDK